LPIYSTFEDLWSTILAIKLQSAFSAVALASSVPLPFLDMFEIICGLRFHAFAAEYFIGIGRQGVHCSGVALGETHTTGMKQRR
jgi:hypothetical protein